MTLNYRFPDKRTIYLALLLLTAFFPLKSPAWAVCPNGMTGYWPLDETIAGTYQDEIGDTALGTCAPEGECPSPTVFGRVNGAVEFAANKIQGIEIPASDAFNWGANESFAIEFWVKTPPGQAAATRVAVGRRDRSSGLLWYVGIRSNGVAALVFTDASGTGYSLFDSGDEAVTVSDGKWHHIVAMRDAVLNWNILYVDGRQRVFREQVFTGDFRSATAPMTIGFVDFSDGLRLNGKVDEVAVYNRLLTSGEIEDHYNNGLGHIRWGYCESPPVAPIRIMPLGDSVTAGRTETLNDVTANPLMTGYRQKLYIDLTDIGYNVDFVGSVANGDDPSVVPAFDPDNESHPGFSPGRIADGVYNRLLAAPPDIILLHVGTDDSGSSGDVDAILDEIDRYETAFDRIITVVLARIINRQPPTQSVTAYNDAVEEVARLRRIRGDRIVVVDMESALNYVDDMSNETLPNGVGYDRMADEWLDGLSQSPDEPENQPPVAEAGNDQAVNEGDTVTLNGSGSADSDGGIVSFRWEQLSGEPTVTLEGANTAVARFTAPAITSTFGFIFRITIEDTGGLRDSDDVLITVNSAPPLSAEPAGPSEAVRSGVTVTLDGARSSGGVTGYAWEQLSGPTVILASPQGVSTTFTAPDVVTGSETLVFRLTVSNAAGETDAAEISVTVLPPLPPSAEAGPNQTVDKGAVVTLDAGGSFGTIASYLWEQTAGTTVSLGDATSPATTFTAPLTGTGDEETLTFRLTVTAPDGQTDTDTVSITVSFVNDPPVADAGPDQTLNENLRVFLDGSASTDPDGGIASYLWEQISGPTVTLAGATAVRASFTTPDVNVSDILRFRLTVTDVGGLSDTDEVLIFVREAQPPVAVAGEDRNVSNGDFVTLDGSASFGTEANITQYFWEQTAGPDVVLADPTAALTTFTAPAVSQDDGFAELLFQLTVTDANTLQATDDVAIVVNFANQPPVADVGLDRTTTEQATVLLNGAGSTDPQGDTLTYRWEQIAGQNVSLGGADLPNVSFIAPILTNGEPESLAFRLTVTDEAGLTSTDEVEVTVTVAPPDAEAGSDQVVLNGVTVILNGTGSASVSGNIAEYQWTQTAGPAVAISAPRAATTSFIAPEVGPEGASLIFELSVTDNRGLTDADTVIVNVTFENNPPVANAGPDQAATEGSVVLLDGSASTDSDDAIAAYLWSQVSGAPVAIANANTATASFTAPVVSVGTEFIFRLQVTDARGLSDTDEATVTVNIGPGPTADAGPDQSAKSGDTITLDGTASFAAVGALASYEWLQTAGPDVILLGATTPQPSFAAPSVPETGAVLTFELTVTDTRGFEDTDTISVDIAFANIPPVAEAGSNRNVVEGAVVGLDGSASFDIDGGIVSYQWEQISGTPVTLTGANSARATFTAPPVSIAGLIFRLTVTDGGGLTDTDQVLITVNVATPPVADAGDDRNAANGEAVTLDGSASFGSSSAIVSYEWEQIGGAPVTLASETGAVTGFTAPSVGRDNLILTFRLTVTDANDLESSDTVTVFVNFENISPVANAGQDQSVTEGATVVLDGTGSFDPDGGIESYQWVQLTGQPVVLADENLVRTTFVAPAVAAEGLLFQLLVSDKTDLTASDEVLITVNDNGVDEFDETITRFRTVTGRSAGLRLEPGSGDFTAVLPLESSTIASAVNRPINFLYGLIQTEIKNATPGNAAVMTVFLSEPAPEDYEWWQFSATDGWERFEDRAVFNDARDRITVTLDDNGEGDEAALSTSPDGFIRTIAGLAREPEEVKDDKNELISCFIGVSGQ